MSTTPLAIDGTVAPSLADGGPTRSAPELLAPAGNLECALAAVENGADAIYFGLDCGFNARFRAQNFTLADLPDLTRLLRERGVRGYATMNTLAFPSELSRLVDVVCQVAEAGVDAVLVQDFGVARIIREACPELEIHASTQMSLTSAETIAVASQLGLARVVLARELSVDEITRISRNTTMPLEVFIHGALCVAYSGQCLTSESLGGRSANRGQCAQACRLPYELICDGETRDLGDMRYLLSPQDLAGYEAIPRLIDAGVASVKIEGRLKTPEYVAGLTSHYRQFIDQAFAEHRVTAAESQRREMELLFSRGLSPGWLEGNDHKRLVPALHNAKLGLPLGPIREINPDISQVRVKLETPLALGDGIAFHTSGESEAQGSRVYSIRRSGNSRRNTENLDSATPGDLVWLAFRTGDIDFSKIDPSSRIYKNDDPQLTRRLRQTFSNRDPQRRQPIAMHVTAVAGKPLHVVASLENGITATAQSADELPVAQKHPATPDQLREKLGRLGGTPFELGPLECVIEGQPIAPAALLNQVRRDVVQQLQDQLNQPRSRTIHRESALRLLEPIQETPPSTDAVAIQVLCRTLEQVEAAAQASVSMIYVDFHDVREYRDAVSLTRQHNVPIAIASVRIQKPGEMGLLKYIVKVEPDAVLARNLAAIGYFVERQIPVIADFSLNVANHRSAEWIQHLGVERLTASYDLNRDQLMDLVRMIPSQWLEVVVHQHMPMFHMEHCVFCAAMSPGTNKTNCGRPCDRHLVQLRDRVGAEHPLQADVACRNTLYNATPQSAAEVMQDLKRSGIRNFRVELLSENRQQAANVLGKYSALLQERLTASDLLSELRATNRVGVTRGTLESKRDPLAIL